MHTAIAVDNCQVMEKAITNSNLLQSILDSMGHLVLTVNPQGFLTHCNQDTQSAIGLQPTELKRKHFTKWYESDENQSFCTDLKRVLDGAVSQVHVRDFAFRIPNNASGPSSPGGWAASPTAGSKKPALLPQSPHIMQRKNLHLLPAAAANGTPTKGGRTRTSSFLKTPSSFSVEASKADTFTTVTYTITPLHDLTSRNKNAGAVMILEHLDEEQKVKAAMGKYMSPNLADKLLQESGTSLSNQIVVSVVFVDIRRFTSLSEQLNVNDVMMLLNEYFHYIGLAVSEEKGTLDKFIGDAVMSVFGVPFPKEDDAIRACRAGLKMVKYINYMNSYRKENGLQGINIGIGINTATVLSGPIGNLHRVEYTVVGDGVNLASRVEGCTKIYSVGLLCTEHTLAQTYNKFEVREVDLIRAAGKKQPVTLYEILREEGDDHLDITKQKSIQCFALGLAAYKNRKWDEAMQCFQQAKTLGNDGPSEVFMQRVQQFQAHPPDKNWDGVWNFTLK
eukprot:TRINITY_DN54251_c0_g1_i1.p1 TRINITY_DN54251_c0_g1~~TRINITY_DN54251_c0_g1_i1.p1  ORF type:complete len:534 (-),score=73.43 TRINITY_DN54251_c0_g1_i1:141-1655(-)